MRKRTFDIEGHLEQLKRRGLRHIDSLIPTVNASLLIVIFEFTLSAVLGFSVMMVVIGRYGIVDNILYSSLRLPPIWYLQYLAEYPQALVTMNNWIDPEQGLHWITLISMVSVLLFFERNLLKQGFTAVHAVSYSIMVAYGSLVFPFEWVYTTLLDIFHNAPQSGSWQLTLYGTWNISRGNIFDSVIGRNGFLALLLFFAWIVGQDAMDGKLKLRFDRISLALFGGIVAGFAFWICLPVIFPSIFANAFTVGTHWFPQDIYVIYGHANWLVNPNAYDILKEYWIPGGIGADYSSSTANNFIVNKFYFSQPSMWYGPIMRLTNEGVKALCTIWCAWTFLPRKVNSSVKVIGG